MKAEEFVKTFTKEEILDALFHKSRLSERAARNLCVALFEEKSDRLLNLIHLNGRRCDRWTKLRP